MTPRAWWRAQAVLGLLAFALLTWSAEPPPAHASARRARERSDSSAARKRSVANERGREKQTHSSRAKRAIPTLPEPPQTLLPVPPLLRETVPSESNAHDALPAREARIAQIRPAETRLWTELSTGYARFDVARLNVQQGVSEGLEVGVGLQVGLGVRVQFMTLGLRLTHAALSAGRISTSGVGVGLRVPLGRFEPFFIGFAGYAWEGGVAERRRASVSGFAGGGQLGLSCFVTRYIAVSTSFETTFVAVAATGVDVDLGSEASLDAARERIERTGIGTLRMVALGLSGHF